MITPALLSDNVPTSVILGAAFAGLWLSGRFVHEAIVDRTTCLPDLEHLGEPTKTKFKGTAVVCGGSFGGLMAARMLTDHFDGEVVVVESEETFEDASRKGVNLMQHNQLHAFGVIVLSAWRKLWPDADEYIKAADGRVTVCNNNLFYGRTVTLPSGFNHEWVNFCRPTAETVLRKMARTHPRIRFVHGTVTGLIPSEDGSDTVSGVTYRSLDAEEDEELSLDASFVVDATGVACRGSKWIESIGYQPPRRDYYDPYGWVVRFLLSYLARTGSDEKGTLRTPLLSYSAYTTAVVQLTPETIAKIPWPKPYAEIGWILAVPCEVGFETRSNYITRWDGDRNADGEMAVAFLQSTFNDLEQTPKTRGEVYAWARSLPMEPWQEALLDVMDEEIEGMEIYRCRLGQFYHLRYNLENKLPQNFVPIADAVMKLNPVYGQGGTKACMDVCTLDGVLRRARRGTQTSQPVPKNLTSLFLKKHSPRAIGLMDFNKALDYPWGNTSIHFPGDTPTQGAMLLSWWKQVAVAMAYSDKVYGMVQEVLQGVAAPTQLFGGRVVWTVLKVKLGLA
ncbi:hypothetical protein FRB90_006837 [Tulasnella sp. 427]|nr:hypothetical protein FRB90_006837 [Tulasnella sp. 427]